MRTFRLILEYDGREFEGWQLQPGGRRTVQGVLEEALFRIAGRRAQVVGASRTDAGVHALGQVASLDLDTDLSPPRLQRALNGVLPPDLAVIGLAEAPGFHALRDAVGKHYRYEIWNGSVASPLRRDRSWWVRPALSLSAMREAARGLEGSHDFAAFQAAHSGARSTERRITELRLEGRAGAQVSLQIRGNGFLRHMVRILAGSLVEVGRGRRPPAWVTDVLASRDRRRAGPTAPPGALTLVRVFFDSDGKSGPSAPRRA